MTNDKLLDEALAGWRAAERMLPAERLSPGARAHIRVLSRRTAPERALAGLFVPLGRLVAAAGVPALLLAVSFAWLIGGGAGRSGPEAAPLTIDTRKVDGQAVFEIANGGQVHRVYRARSAAELDGAELFATTTASFEDALEGDSGVVYYRID